MKFSDNVDFSSNFELYKDKCLAMREKASEYVRAINFSEGDKDSVDIQDMLNSGEWVMTRLISSDDMTEKKRGGKAGKIKKRYLAILEKLDLSDDLFYSVRRSIRFVA